MRHLVLIFSLLLSLPLFAKPMEDISAATVETAPAGSLLILDVRSHREYTGGHVPDAIHIPHDQLANRLSELQSWRDKSVVVYCETGYRANIAASVLADKGFKKVYHLVGGMRDWRTSGREIAF